MAKINPSPHVCGVGPKSECCPGWSKRGGQSGLCTVPICHSSCGESGRCIRPNVCFCKGGQLQPFCSGRPGTEVAPLPPAPAQSRLCREDCLNGGQCIGPDRCACVYGFTGRRCERDYRTGPCFRKVQQQLCAGQLPGVVCTRQLCCATVGVAWGHPCEQCPAQPPCDKGFISSLHSACQDVDECEAIPGICEKGKCVNTLGSFRCECQEGYHYKEDNGVCEDVDECEANPDLCTHGQCVNTEGAFKCICDYGFIPTQKQRSCLDTRREKCFLDVVNSECRSLLAFRLSRVECCCGENMGKGWGEQSCLPCPLRGSRDYSQLCLESSIPDINECDLRGDLCENGLCINLPSSYRCECNKGFRPLNNNRNCEDIDECQNATLCQNGHCLNIIGSFTCICPSGYELTSDGTRCSGQDECSTNSLCPNGVCVNGDGSHACKCNLGFTLSATGKSCIDIDECKENGRICLWGRCENTPGSYKCFCQAGFVHSPGGDFCTDKNECEEGVCWNGICTNSVGSFDCICNPGYKLSPDGRSCIDLNECAETSDACLNGRCENTDGSYRCTCMDGMIISKTGRHCIDSRREYCFSHYKSGECSQPSSVAVTWSACCCAGRGALTPAWGSACTPCPALDSRTFLELCPSGPGSGALSDDINECAVLSNICPNGACENLKGSYRCICNPGYKVDASGKICSDVNECAINLLLCERGQCRNTPGSFQCTCPTGFRHNTLTNNCDDINECQENAENICIGGTCFNTPGSYLCECEPGSALDISRNICVDNRRGSCWTSVNDGRCENDLKEPLLKSECCGTVGKAWGSPCQLCSEMNHPCSKGYGMLDGSTCTDINECEIFPNICERGGLCLNIEGSYRCNCAPGLTLDASGTKCYDLREEACYLQLERGKCSKPFAGVYKKMLCCCSLGRAWGSGCELCPRPGTEAFNELCVKGFGYAYDGNGRTEPRFLTDINECIQFPSICHNGRCQNTVGSFSCQCNPGFAQDSKGLNCIDINECAIAHGICANGTCHNTAGSFQCDCNEGFEDVMMMQMCNDINECTRIRGLCRGGLCVNLPGSFRCDCLPGHELAPNGRTCKDIDECSRTSGICSNGVCENMMGSYQCTCNHGYMQTSQHTSCEDIDECAVQNGGCQSLCINVPGSYKCSCNPGHHLMPDESTCEDVDECKDVHNICSGGKCTNYAGSHACHCTGGLMPSENGKSCLDIDECATNPEVCQKGQCENMLGSFVCHCDFGFSVKSPGQGCSDDDECEVGPNECDEHAECQNILGSYECHCLDGFVGDGFDCKDKNECLKNNGGCHPDAACINTPGSFQCLCDEGFTGDGQICTDIDECTLNPSLCENGQCLNYGGSYKCECDMGFAPEDSERTCVDINECVLFQNNCVFGWCENSFGQFRCICDVGYELDDSGGNCTDIDECNNPQICQYGTCVNTMGSYICQCPPNYSLAENGAGCIDLRQGECFLDVAAEYKGWGLCSSGLGEGLAKATCCCSVGKGWGPSCEVCPLLNSTEYQQLCPGGKGFRPNQITVVLEDIDECRDLSNVCRGGRCSNTFGSFMCICPEGFTLDFTERNCIDLDECSLRPDVCGEGACINSEGSYLCVCPPDYVLVPSGTCVDMRKSLCFRQAYEPDTRPPFMVCEHPMMSNQTRMTCCCSVGHAWGEPCELCPPLHSENHKRLCTPTPGTYVNPMTGNIDDVDECKTGVCENGICTNTIGSFFCECNKGFHFNKLINKCEDVNECVELPEICQGAASCINSIGSFECTCPDGYKLMPNERECSDINECSKTGMCDSGVCKNLDGSFVCTCNNGFQLSPSGEHCLDIDECVRSPGICSDGVCTNQLGSYKCECNPGFQQSHNGDCIDIDECKTQLGVCRKGRCRNTVGSFTCQCQDGFSLSLDNRECIDVNECFEEDICLNGECRNAEGSFDCLCNEGYHLTSDLKHCDDVDECQTVISVCDGGFCTNQDGSYTCSCFDGFRLSSDGKECIDVREGYCYQEYREGVCRNPKSSNMTRKECCCMKGSSAWGNGPCEPCPEPRSDKFKKMCPEGPGYVTTNGVTEDINECMMDPTLCENGSCINMDGTFRCECGNGFKIDPSGIKCTDLDECREVRSICGNGTCINIVGGFECDCNEGFTAGPSGICEDYDECEDVGLFCAFRCQNTPGSFKCICPFGYTTAVDGRHCEDFDECQTPANDCRYDCKNLIGSFMCICPSGYRPLPPTDDCQDIDECVVDPSVCGNGICRNTQGSYQCDCYEGFQLSPDQKTCVDLRAGNCFSVPSCSVQMPANVTKIDCCCGMGEAWGPWCELCPFKGSKEYDDLCPHGPGFDANGRDVDECGLMPNLCFYGHCINTMGSYRCICNKGYKPVASGNQCTDINECELNPAPCKFSCRNTEGSFRCSCPDGYMLAIDGITCNDINECRMGLHSCQEKCVNTLGSYQCSCHKGFREVSGQCVDINECTEKPYLCTSMGTCMNIPGSFKCLCQRGFTLDPSGEFCTDTNECLDETRCQHGCENTIGGYRCACPEGFRSQDYWNQCIELEGSSCLGSACAYGCSSGGPTGYSCNCPNGYQRLGQGHCLSTIPATLYDSPSSRNSRLNDFTTGYSDFSSLENWHATAGEKVISTEGCYSCKLSSNGRPKRSASRLSSMTKRQRGSLQKHQKREEFDNLIPALSKLNATSRRRDLHTTLSVPLNRMRPSLDLLKIRSSLTFLINKEKFEIIDGNRNNTFKISYRKGIAVLHTKEVVRIPTSYRLRIQNDPLHSAIKTGEFSPFHFTLHLIVTEL